MKRQKIKRYQFSVAQSARRTSRMRIVVVALLGLCVLAAVVLGAGRALQNQTSGWQGDGLHRYFVSASTGQRITGLYEIDHKLYYFGENGFLKTNWIRENGYVGYADENGVLQQGEAKVDGKYYYFQPGTGQLYTGWLTLDGAEYCFDETGHPRTGSYNEDGRVWELDKDGRVKEQLNGWKKTDGVLKYYDASGALAQGWMLVDGKDYLFADGISQMGWAETEDGLRYLDGNGNRMTGWCVIDGQPYAFDADGQLKQGWDHSHGRSYYFADGISKSGTYQEGRASYDLNGSGSIQPASEAVPEEDLSQDAEGEAPDAGLLEQQPAPPEMPVEETTTQETAEPEVPASIQDEPAPETPEVPETPQAEQAEEGAAT